VLDTVLSSSPSQKPKRLLLCLNAEVRWQFGEVLLRRWVATSHLVFFPRALTSFFLFQRLARHVSFQVGAVELSLEIVVHSFAFRFLLSLHSYGVDLLLRQTSKYWLSRDDI
jgi:hypothetical protein